MLRKNIKNLNFKVMKKFFIPMSVVTILVTGLLMNLSINSSKEEKRSHLFEMNSKANASCENNYIFQNDGRCSATQMKCVDAWPYYDNADCCFSMCEW